MRIMFLVVFIATVLSGCSVGVNTPVLDANVSTGSRLLGINSGLRVVYPHPSETGSYLVKKYGPEWRNIQGHYPGYRFN